MHFRRDLDVKRAVHQCINEYFIIEIKKIFKKLNCNFFKTDLETLYQRPLVDVKIHCHHLR